jgi:ArsR family transcriptional regulator, arsenate/arsenite/antimonite-responsive transcriptional repressor
MSNYIPPKIDSYSTAFGALSNPHRLQIYTMLSGCCDPGERCLIESTEPCCVGDIGRRLNIAASTLSHHLKELNRANLIRMDRDGKQIYCSVNPAMLMNIRAFFNNGPTPCADQQPDNQ